MTGPGRETTSIFRFERLADYPVIHGVTSRDSDLPGDGDINIAGRLPREHAIQNRARWCEVIGVDSARIVTGRQAHGDRVRIVDRSDMGRGALSIEEAIPGTDALATREIGVPLMIYTADCVPIVLYDPNEHVVGLAHAGWRGTVKNVAGALVREMAQAFDANPADFRAYIGPSIGSCCYEVGEEVVGAWNATDVPDHMSAVSQPRERYHFDLWRANTLELRSAGVRTENIELAGICTKCHADQYFSRRAGNGHRGLFATIVELRPR